MIVAAGSGVRRHPLGNEDEVWLRLEGVSVGGDFAGHGAALVAISPLEKYIDQEIYSEDAKGYKNVQRHRSLPRVSGIPASA